MKRCIVHVPFDVSSGVASSRRPHLMVGGFVENGYEVEFISGCGARRKSIMNSIRAKVELGVEYDFIYFESSTAPTLLTESHHLPLYPNLDYGFISYLRGKGVRAAGFYRDVYWKFPLYDESVSYIKGCIAKLLYKYDLSVYRRIFDVLYMPSVEMREYLPELRGCNVKALPPGCDSNIVLHDRNNRAAELRVTYVGSVLPPLYAIDVLVRYFAGMATPSQKLTIICPEDQYDSCDSSMKRAIARTDAITVLHARGAAVRDALLKSDVALCYFEPHEYRRFAVPLKLFEYWSCGLPIICNKDTACGSYVERYGLGWPVDYNVSALGDILGRLERGRDELVRARCNAMRSRSDHSWSERARKVINDLS